MRERLFLNDSQRRLAEQNLNIVSRVIYQIGRASCRERV